MTANPLKEWAADSAKPTRNSHEWCTRANHHAAEIGRTDIRWVVRDGVPCIEWAVPPQGRM